MTILEREIEAKLIGAVNRHGGMCLKWVCPGWAGVPDRIVLMPGGNRTNGKYDRSAEASVNENGLTRQELEICAKRVLNFLLTCPATAKKIK